MISQIQLYQAVKKIMEGEYGAKDNEMCINSEAKQLSAPHVNIKWLHAEFISLVASYLSDN